MKSLTICAHLAMISNLMAMNSVENVVITGSQSYQLLDMHTVPLSPLVPKSQSSVFLSITPMYDVNNMELTVSNLSQFMNINQTKLTRRTSCFANVLVNVIYSYICLYLLKDYDEQKETLPRNDILNDLYSYRTKAKNECLFVHGELIRVLDFLYDSRLIEEKYEEVFQSWSKKTTNLVEHSPVNSSTPLLDQVKNLFYRIKPVSTEKTVTFVL